jgi:hypothetical protein
VSDAEGRSSVMYEGAARGLLEFLEYVKAKGMLAARTADAYKWACSRVLGIDGGWEELDVRALDVEHQMERYVRLHGASASPASLTTYGSRVRAAIELYRTFLDNPTGFRGRSAKPRVSGASVRMQQRIEKPPQKAAAVQVPPRDPPEATLSLVTYPFPLRSGMLAYLQLPRDISVSDVRRLCGFLESLAIDDGEDARSGGGR